MRMRSSRKWLKSIGKKFGRSSHSRSRDIVYSYTVPTPNQQDEELDEDDEQLPTTTMPPNGNHHHHQLENFKGNLEEEDAAAIKIQATFRAHLARRAFKALRSVVKLQALARGAYVRKQTQLALHCMHALVRLQVRVRTRQLLGSFDV